MVALERLWMFASDTLQPLLFILFFILQVYLIPAQRCKIKEIFVVICSAAHIQQINLPELSRSDINSALLGSFPNTTSCGGCSLFGLAHGRGEKEGFININNWKITIMNIQNKKMIDSPRTNTSRWQG